MRSATFIFAAFFFSASTLASISAQNGEGTIGLLAERSLESGYSAASIIERSVKGVEVKEVEEIKKKEAESKLLNKKEELERKKELEKKKKKELEKKKTKENKKGKKGKLMRRLEDQEDVGVESIPVNDDVENDSDNTLVARDPFFGRKGKALKLKATKTKKLAQVVQKFKAGNKVAGAFAAKKAKIVAALGKFKANKAAKKAAAAAAAAAVVAPAAAAVNLAAAAPPAAVDTASLPSATDAAVLLADGTLDTTAKAEIAAAEATVAPKSPTQLAAIASLEAIAALDTISVGGAVSLRR